MLDCRAEGSKTTDMRPFFSALMLGSILIGFVVPAAWVLTPIAALCWIVAAPPGKRPDGKAKTGGILGGVWDSFAVSLTMAPCIYCQELVRKDSLKCKHCGEWYSENRTQTRGDWARSQKLIKGRNEWEE